MILSFAKPKKLHSTEEHNAMYSSDSGVAGTYAPNMDWNDMLKWKAKQIGGKDPRIEIRKSVDGIDPNLKCHLTGKAYSASAQILIIVRPDKVIMSANGRMVFDGKIWDELHQAVAEAKQILVDSAKQAG